MYLPFIMSRDNCSRLDDTIRKSPPPSFDRSASPMFPKWNQIYYYSRVVFANRACNTVKVHTRSISAKRANRLFRTHGLSGSSGLQDIAAETRKRVNASTLSLTSIRLARHRINGMPQFPSAHLPAERSRATPARPCHFVWQDLNDRRSIIRGSRGAYAIVTLIPLEEKEDRFRITACFFTQYFDNTR